MAVRRSTTNNVAPALIAPDHFFCNQSSTIVVIYNEPLGKEMDGVTLMFPGNLPSSSPQRVVPQRVGNRTLVFETPVYSASRGMVQVLPLLNLPSGEVELAPFKIGIKHPVRNVMELCLKLSSSSAVLPVLIALMVHSVRECTQEAFQDPHIDRIMATLAGSRFPGASTNIKDIILPERKWRHMSLSELAREFQLLETEKQAYSLRTSRMKWRKRNQKTRTIPEAASCHKVCAGRNVPLYENIRRPLLSSRDQRRRSSSDIEVAVYPRPDDVRYRTLSTDRPGGQPISDPEDLRRSIQPHYANFSELHMSTDFQRRRSSSDIEVAVYPRPDDVRYRTLSTDRPGGQPISDPEDLRRPIRPHYANFSELYMSTDFQFAAGACGSDVPIVSQKQHILAPSGASYIDRYKSQSVGSDLDTTPPPEMLPMRPHGRQGLPAFPIHRMQMHMTTTMADRMNAVDEESLTESSSEEDQCSTGDRRRTTPPYYYAKTESLQPYPTVSKEPPPKLKRPVPKPRKIKPLTIAGDNHQATSNQQSLDYHRLSDPSPPATKWFESQPASSQHGIRRQHNSAYSMSMSASGNDETRDSVIFTLM